MRKYPITVIFLSMVGVMAGIYAIGASTATAGIVVTAALGGLAMYAVTPPRPDSRPYKSVPKGPPPGLMLTGAPFRKVKERHYDHVATAYQNYLDHPDMSVEELERSVEAAIAQNVQEGHHDGAL